MNTVGRFLDRASRHSLVGHSEHAKPALWPPAGFLDRAQRWQMVAWAPWTDSRLTRNDRSRSALAYTRRRCAPGSETYSFHLTSGHRRTPRRSCASMRRCAQRGFGQRAKFENAGSREVRGSGPHPLSRGATYPRGYRAPATHRARSRWQRTRKRELPGG